MAPSSLNKVLVIGAGGNVGRSTVKALLAEGFSVTGVTREHSESVLPAGVRHIKSDFSEASLSSAMEAQDAVVCAISSIVPGGALSLQKSIIDIAVKQGVKAYFPSEYGIDTSDRAALQYIPFLEDKIAIVDHLKTVQDKMSWTAIISGSMFDWGFNIPGFGGWNLAARSATIFDGGDISYEATNLDQVGRAVAKSLKHPELTRNKYVYINSFTVTQNKVLAALESATGEKFAVSHDTVENLWQGGADQVKAGNVYGVLAQIAGAIYGRSGLAQFSVKKGLWNDRLGLPQEDLEGFIKEFVAKKL